jgi:AcrR family transcriptional regulator
MSEGSPPGTPNPQGEGQRRRILEAARRCFERYGVQRTRMEDIAGELGMSRALLYTYYGNRQKLIDAVLIDAVREFAAHVQPRILAYDTFAEAVVEGSIVCIKAGRGNQSITALVTSAKSNHVSDLLLRPTEVAQAMSRELWHPVIERARARGEVREDLNEENFNEWIAGIHLLWWLREQVDEDHLRAQLHFFLVPALTAPGTGRSGGRLPAG